MRLVGLVGLTLASVLLLAPALARAADPCDTGFCSTGCLAAPCYKDSNEAKPGTGVPVRWETLPIKYKVNVADLVSGQKLDETKVIDAIKAAFATWEAAKCSNLKFLYAGKSTSYSQETGHILVAFQNDKAWMEAYFVNMGFKTIAKGDIEFGVIRLNSTPVHPTYSFKYSLGAAANSFDVQTMVTFLIPMTIGIKVEKSNGQTPIAYNKVQTALCKEHEDAAAFTYFDSTGTGCTKPTVAFCASSTPTTDGGTKDGSTTTDGGTTKKDTGGTTGDGPGPTGDGGLPPPESDDGGCCRVSHARSSDLPYLSLLGLALLLVVARRRLRR